MGVGGWGWFEGRGGWGLCEGGGSGVRVEGGGGSLRVRAVGLVCLGVKVLRADWLGVRSVVGGLLEGVSITWRIQGR